MLLETIITVFVNLPQSIHMLENETKCFRNLQILISTMLDIYTNQK